MDSGKTGKKYLQNQLGYWGRDWKNATPADEECWDEYNCWVHHVHMENVDALDFANADASRHAIYWFWIEITATVDLKPDLLSFPRNLEICAMGSALPCTKALVSCAFRVWSWFVQSQHSSSIVLRQTSWWPTIHPWQSCSRSSIFCTESASFLVCGISSLERIAKLQRRYEIPVRVWCFKW